MRAVAVEMVPYGTNCAASLLASRATLRRVFRQNAMYFRVSAAQFKCVFVCNGIASFAHACAVRKRVRLAAGNSFATLFSSIGSMFAALLLGIWVNLFLAAPVPGADRYVTILEWIFGIGATVSYGVAAFHFRSRGEMVARIKAESKQLCDED